MKRIAVVLSLLFASSPGARCADAQGESPSSAEAEEPSVFEARVTSVEGDVFIYPKDSEEGFAAEEDAPIEPGDRVETRGKSRVELALEADSVMELGAHSVFTADDLSSERSVFSLSLGTLVAKFKAYALKARRHAILTPTVVAAVRGTEFGVEVSEEGRTSVGVFDEGQVGVTAQEEGIEETLLGPQEEISVPREEIPTETRDGRLYLKRGRQEAFKRHFSRLKRLRERRAQLRKRWRKMRAKDRARLRGEMLARHKARLERMSPRQKAKLRERMKRREVRFKINRERLLERHRRIRDTIRNKRRENLRRKGKEELERRIRRKTRPRQGRPKPEKRR